jgi:3D (Asp-Asp-Asp) domain-containing protein
MLKFILTLVAFSFIAPMNSQAQIPSRSRVKDFKVIPSLQPTTYYIAQENKTSCSGKYGGVTYKGKERTRLLELDGSYIATVCTRFYKVLSMEGSAILKSRGAGKFAVNYSGVKNKQVRFHVLSRCKYGEGVKKDLCLLPYHSLAADLSVHKVGDVIYIPLVRGMRLPDGSSHDGFFIVRDTGGAFRGVGGRRVDMFTGTAPDNNNLFINAGFDRRRPMKAYKVRGVTADQIREDLQHQFRSIY